MERSFTEIVSGQSFTEAPRWHEGRLWFSDFYTLLVQSVREDGSDLRLEAEVPGQPSGLGWLPDGRLLIVSQHDHLVLRREPDGTLVTHADLSSLVTAHLNDMVVDAEGRAFVGNFGFDLMGGDAVTSSSLIRVDPDGTVTPVADELWFPNGMAITADGRLLVNETFGNRVTSFAIAADGSLTDRRTWASFGPEPVEAPLETALAGLVIAPDGCAIDDEGHLWIADAIGGRVVRVREGGEIVEEITATTGVFACALGGADGHTLFLNAAPDFLESNRRPVREATILATQVDATAP
ncbi:SMP-30/gluconolactonase/LRE family protein [Aeromicrobium alkaliterrae]|uniref:SMP-30/gluconolactonase/LRE family protein n=1 Tax=Aeromicrobium alkaliterrae TaxID=302168 RepID=A0ABN2K6G2_9ACTN